MALNRESVIRAAEKYVSRGKLEAGIKEYRKVLAENPNDANTLNRVGDLYARIERFGEAVKLFTQIAEQYTRDGFFVKAIAIYKKIIKLDPSSLQVYERLAELYFKQGLLNEARTQYQVLADYYQKHDNAASAISIFQKMAEIEPENPTFHLKLAELFESQRLTDKALASYRQLADLLIVNGSIEEAAQVFLRALDIGSGDLDFIRSTVVGLHEDGHVGAAARVLARAVESNPAAAAVAEEIGLAEGQQPPETEPSETEPSETEPSETEPPETETELPDFGAAAADESEPAPEHGFAAPPVLDETDATFVLPSETTFADLEAEAAAAAADVAAGFASFAGADSQPDEELEVFTLDLEDDEIPDTLVAPPPDMLEPAASEDLGESHSLIPDEQEAVVELDEPETGDEPSFEIDLSEVDLDLADSEAPAPVAEAEPAPTAGRFEFSLDLDDLEDDDEPSAIGLAALPAAPATAESAAAEPAAAEPAEFELADVDLAAEPTELEPTELEPAELEPAEPEPVELELAEIELDDLELEIEPPVEVTDLEPATLEPAPALEVDPGGPPSVRREEDLLAEARVFAKYGLEEKALDRLGELIELQPNHVEGLELKTRIFFEGGRHQEALATANEVARVAQETGNLEPWHELRADLVDAGYAIEDEQVLDEPLQKPVEDDRIAQLLEDLSLEDFDSTGLAPLEDAMPVSAEMPLEPGLPEVLPTVTDSPPPQPLDAEPKPKRKLVSLVEELDLQDLQDDPEELAAAEADAAPAAVEASAQAAAETAAETAADLDETGMSWLDDVASADEAAVDRDEALFEEEDDFFDLAAELERELTEDDLADGVLVQPQEQSLEEIIEGFKQGVAENLSPEDYETHFNLGIAYREMGLLDEAIGEFQLASKDERYIVDCSSLLGVCFLEKGLPDLAMRWYRKGLAAPSINDDATIGLLYDMGDAYLSLGDAEAASKTFIEVYGLNSNYRDVAAKLEELGAVL